MIPTPDMIAEDVQYGRDDLGSANMRWLSGRIFSIIHDARYMTHRETLKAIDDLVFPIAEASLDV